MRGKYLPNACMQVKRCEIQVNNSVFINHPKNSLEKTCYSQELVIFALDTKIRIMT